jgi:hypothetical protein
LDALVKKAEAEVDAAFKDLDNLNLDSLLK